MAILTLPVTTEVCVADELLTLAQAAELLGCSRWTVYKLVEDGKLPTAVLPGKRRQLVLKSEVLRLKAAGVRKPGRPRKEG